MSYPIPHHRVVYVQSVESVVWRAIAPLPPMTLADGSGPALQQTETRLGHDGRLLHVRFDCADSDIWGTYRQQNDPIYDEEVVEVFLAAGADDPKEYIELEISPNGVLFAARVANLTGDRAQMTLDMTWLPSDLAWAAKRDDANGRWWATFAIPLDSVAACSELPPVWRANFYRIERPRSGIDEYSCWSPTLTEPADFHKPARFGILTLE